jgi:hypothetical protein
MDAVVLIMIIGPIGILANSLDLLDAIAGDERRRNAGQ